jgi:hypothetical protein
VDLVELPLNDHAVRREHRRAATWQDRLHGVCPDIERSRVRLAAPATVKSVTVPLDGGPLFINTSSDSGEGNIDFTATGSCYTPSGQPQT